MWRVPECVTPKYASMTHGLFWAKGHWGLKDKGKTLKTGHKFLFYKGNFHL